MSASQPPDGAADHCEAGARTLHHAVSFGWLDRGSIPVLDRPGWLRASWTIMRSAEGGKNPMIVEEFRQSGRQIEIRDLR